MKQPGIAVQKKRMKRSRVIAGAVFASLALGFVLFSQYGLVTRLRLELENRDYRKQIDAASTTQDSLLRYARVLKSDTLEIERIARENYGMVRPGEDVFIIEKND